MKQRIIGSCFLIIIVVFGFFQPFNIVFKGLLCSFLSLALFEFLQLNCLKLGMLELFFSVLFGYLVLSAKSNQIVSFFLLYLIVISIIHLTKTEGLAEKQNIILKHFFAFFYFFGFGHVLLLLRELPNGTHWLLWMIVTVKMGDVGAYIIGSSWGKKKIAPTITPHKTWIGVFANSLFSIIVGLILEHVLLAHCQIHRIRLLIMIVCLNFFSQWGDLFESLIKRNSHAKNSGNLIPGIGGIMDLLDSLIFSISTTSLILLGSIGS